MSGIWGLFAFPGIIKSLRDEKEYKFFMAVSAVILVVFYSLSYWNKTAFGPIIGIERHILLIAPMVAFFAIQSFDKYKVHIISLALIIVLIVPSLKKDNEIAAVEEASNQLKKMQYSRLYTEHCFVNYYLKKPISGNDISRFADYEQYKKNDIMIWESHYAARKISYENLKNDWSLLWHKQNRNFVILILRKN